MPGKLLNSAGFKTAVFMLPYVYFMILFLLINDGEYTWIAAILFFVQMLFHFRFADIILGIIMSLISFWLLLAYFSDINKITEFNSQSLSFILGGAAFVLMQFTMTFLLFRNDVMTGKSFSQR